MTDKPNRRKAILPITWEALITLILEQTDNLPKDVEFVAQQYDYVLDQIQIKLTSTEFKEIPESEPCPYLYPAFTSYRHQIEKFKALAVKSLEYLEDVQDEGPRGEGWQSDELKDHIKKLEELSK